MTGKNNCRTYINKHAIMLPSDHDAATREPENVVEIPQSNVPIGEGVFGIVELRKILTQNFVVAAKFSRDRLAAIDSEIRTMDALKGPSSAPNFYCAVTPRNMLIKQQIKDSSLNPINWL